MTLSLEPGEVYSLTVLFNPEGIGEDNADLVILSNDPNESEFHLPLAVNVVPAPQVVLSEESMV